MKQTTDEKRRTLIDKLRGMAGSGMDVHGRNSVTVMNMMLYLCDAELMAAYMHGMGEFTEAIRMQRAFGDKRK